MAIKNKALTINFLVWDTSLNVGKTGDGANVTLNIIKDGGASTSVTNSISEPSSANMPGVYELALTSTEMNADFITVGGKSSTADTVVFPVFIQTDQGDLAIIDTSTSGTNTLINGLNDVSTSEIDTTITNNTTISNIDSNTSAISTDVNIIEVNGTSVSSINEFKADVSSLATEANATSNKTAINSNTDSKIGALNDISTTEVKTQVTNAITVDTISELNQATPAIEPTLANAIMLAYMDLRNKRTATSSEYGIHNDAGVKIAKGALSDDGTTFTKDELISGA